MDSIRRIEGVADTITYFVIRESVYRPNRIAKGGPWRGFLFAGVVPNSTSTVLEALPALDYVVHGAAITGEYDIGAYIVADSMEEFTDMVLKIRNIAGIVSPETLLAAE